MINRSRERGLILTGILLIGIGGSWDDEYLHKGKLVGGKRRREGESELEEAAARQLKGCEWVGEGR